MGADFVVEEESFADFVAEVTDPSAVSTFQSLHLTAVFLALNFIRRGDTESEAIKRLRSILY